MIDFLDSSQNLLPMFIRRKVKTLKGQSYEQHQLLKSVRTPAGPRQEVVLNIGPLDLPKDQWKALANAIEQRVNNQSDLLFSSCTEEVDRYADHFAQMIVSKAINQQSSSAQAGNAEEYGPQSPDYQRVDVNSVRTSESRSLGAEHVVLEQMKAYGFDPILSDLGFTSKQIAYAKHLVVGRAVHPCSERELARWINQDSALKELIGSDEAVYDNALHRGAAQLFENREEIEKALRKKAVDLFSLDEKIILYDLTNTYFEGRKTGSEIAQFGRSKEKRSDCKLATLALVVDAKGFPKQSRILKGNICEPETFAAMLESVSKLGDSPAEKTIVLDAGIATEENIASIKAQGMRYVAISRKQSYAPSLWDQSEEKSVLLKDGKTKLSLKLATVPSPLGLADSPEQGDCEAFLLCHSPLKEEKEKQIVQRRIKKFEEGLDAIAKSLEKAKTPKLHSKIMERIGRLKEKYPVGSCFDIEVKNAGGRVQEIAYRRNAQGSAKLEKLGQYVIRTNRLDLDEAALSEVHRSLTTIESSFRSMKSDLGLRPNFHKNETATIAHIFISVLAYHIVRPVLSRLGQAQINHTWSTVRSHLSSHDRVVTVFNTEDGHCVHVRNTTTANLSQKTIYNALGVKHDPLKNVSLKTSPSMEPGSVVPKT